MTTSPITKSKSTLFLSKTIQEKNLSICILGMGYVGLPLAIEFGKHYAVQGIDICSEKIKNLQKNTDITGEIESEILQKSTVSFSTDPSIISKSDIIIVTVPTPINENNTPDLSLLITASKCIGKYLSKNSIVIYESTVYPGVTEEICLPILEKESGLTYNSDFFLGYSPERLSPGEKKHTLPNVVKVVSGSTPEIATLLEELYGNIVPAGIHKAPSIKVAEAAKVIENTQRDLNVALMNELSIIFNKMDINTLDVINAASTKWNFMKMTPGLVGGHCIGVDPYYLTHKSKQLGYHPDVILAGRRINDGMGNYIASELIKLLIKANIPVKNAKIGLFGLTFKEDVSDIRNTKVIDIIKELNDYKIKIMVHDPHANKKETANEYGITIVEMDQMAALDGIIIAVPHSEYKTMTLTPFIEKLNPHQQKVIYDLKSIFKSDHSKLNHTHTPNLLYQSL